MADRTSSRTIVDASRASVMAVIADFAAYPEWASAVKSAEVIEQEPDGRARRVKFILDAGVIRDTYVLVYDWDAAGTRVSWHLDERTAVLSAMTGSYVLSDRDVGTEVVYELTVGVRIPMLGMVKRRAEKMIIDTALKGLRKRVERMGDA
jgi:polyketide cyclase/dehydrase/lipid transport protein